MPRISSRTYVASLTVAGMTLVPYWENWSLVYE